jgi:hypothetical protein
MKLYTEEQLREAYNRGRTDWINEIEDYYIFSELTPIELPSDEEIRDKSFNKFTQSNARTCFEEGAKWMKEQILNQNK